MTQDLLAQSVGQLANHYARKTVFPDYLERKAAHTLRRQKADLTLFSRYLQMAGLPLDPNLLQTDPSSWAAMTHGLVEGFLRWQIQEGYAIGSVNVRLSTVKC